MKSYQTSIVIKKSVDQVWKVLTDFETYPQWNPLVGELKGSVLKGEKIKTHIIPLGKSYYPTVLSFKKETELIWQGTHGPKFLLAGEHYYKLEKIGKDKTELIHGEYFTGILSYFLPKYLIQEMKNAFVKHNEVLKNRVENGS